MTKYLGILLIIIGFILIPLGIGVLICMGGWLLLIFDFYKTWINRLVPKEIQQKVGSEIKKSYIPYQPAIKGMKSIGKDVVKSSAIALVIIIIITVVIFLIRFKPDGTKDFGDKKTTPLPNTKEECLAFGGVWEKQGPDPFETCDKKTTDRGNLCRDSSECQGTCQVDLTKEELSLGMKGKLNIKKDYGQCSVWMVELGCRGIMKQGKVQVICLD